MMRVLAVDQAPRHIGFCYGESKVDAVPTWGVLDLPSFGDNTDVLIRTIRKWLKPLCEKFKPDVIYYENFFNNGNNNTYRNQCLVAAVVEVVADDVAADCYEVDVKLWRKRALGQHNKPKWAPENNDDWLKEAAIRACADRNFLVSDHNAAEAILIFDYGCAHCDRDYMVATKPRVARVLMERENADRAFKENRGGA